MSNETAGWICLTILVILTLGTPDILDGLIAIANGAVCAK